MTRRFFLSALAAVAADPEKLLWKPGKLISIPKPPVVLRSVQGVVLHSRYVYDPLTHGTRFDILYGFNFAPELMSVEHKGWLQIVKGI